MSGKSSPQSPGEGSPSDRDHAEVGDGVLQGSIPAGLTADELKRRTETEKPGSDAATG